MSARPMLRSPVLRFAARRYQSTSTQDIAAKASQGLSRVSSAAGPAIAGAAKGVAGALGKVGGRTGKVVNFIERQIPFVVYYSKVGLEVGKYIAHGQKMSLPSVATFQTYYRTFFESVKSGRFFKSPQAILQSIRSVSPLQLASGGVVLAELLGFFTVGEMIGRFKLVGYHGEASSHH
ncbi:F-type H+-transporting ATPase subunit g [Geosmithia morbida]|uniref:F-type H+-transporting ATPase subunit g n=1 Tax=Geosmithia morbida TaxID=1094350 RepID=A0A9P4Z0D7_9HYPO|nr:F-type H+-transporting ATPase subunit g [Geosmithia morbida]KAF4125107.1 F-type H+-transporting ATPase subunit g [Geosmithia morbida]